MISSRLRTRARRRLEQIGLTALHLTLHPLSRLMPRRADRWAFGHQGGSFAGNPKYLFLWMRANRPDLRVTWIGADPATRRLMAEAGLDARARWSPRGLWAALRARVHVFAHGADDVHLSASNGALLLNLWHGVGLKATMLGDAGGVVARHWHHRHGRLRRAFYLGHVTMPDIVVTTSDFMQDHFSRQFRLPRERCPQLGYSRLDPAGDDALERAARAIDAAAGAAPVAGSFGEVLLYMPTFRDSGRDFLGAALPDLPALDAILARRNAVLYVKLHPRTAAGFPAAFRHIRPWPDVADIYAHLSDVDVLITDYSSVLYDYLQSRSGGMVLYTFDYDEYVAQDRSLLYPFDENVAGLRVADFAALCAAIESGAALSADATGRAAIVRRRFWGEAGGPASPRIVAHVEAALAPPRPAGQARSSRPLPRWRITRARKETLPSR